MKHLLKETVTILNTIWVYKQQVAVGLLYLSIVVAAVWAVYYSMTSLSSTVNAIVDPVERGLAYVAVSIAFHTLFSTPRIVKDK